MLQKITVLYVPARRTLEKKRSENPSAVCNTPPELYLEMHFTLNLRKWKTVGDCPVVQQEMRSVFVFIRTYVFERK